MRDTLRGRTSGFFMLDRTTSTRGSPGGLCEGVLAQEGVRRRRRSAPALSRLLCIRGTSRSRETRARMTKHQAPACCQLSPRLPV